MNYVYLPTDQDNTKMVKNVLVEISMNLPFSIPYAKDILNEHILVMKPHMAWFCPVSFKEFLLEAPKL